MMKKLLSLLLFACLALSALASCNTASGSNNSSSPSSESTVESSSDSQIEEIDYAGSVTLDMNSDSLKQEVTVKTYVDGDTTHFNVPKTMDPFGVLKARYIAINTPESTGTIEPWGKKAAKFTKEKLSGATSIIIETDGTEWEADSTGDRYLVWVWYKTAGASEYRNLNIEILQNGLAVGNKAGISRYGTTCTSAISQAKKLGLHVHSKDKDPDFYYGDAYEITLKELRTNIEEYNGKRVAFSATATIYNDWNVYLEDFDEETGLYYGISVFYGYNGTFHSILAPGNRVRVVGKVSFYEAGGTYQISDLKYDLMDPNNPNNTITLEEGHKAAYNEVSLSDFLGNVTIEKEELDIVTGNMITVKKDYSYSSLVMSTTISMKGLKVVDMYTTSNGGNNDGAISITCQDANGNKIVVRTAVLKNADGSLVTEDMFRNKTIDVKGIVDMYDGEYQIKVFHIGSITIY